MTKFKPYKIKNNLFKILFYFLLYISIAVILLPFFVMILNSLMSERELFNNNFPNFHFIPKEFSSISELFQNYTWFYEKSGKALTTFINSLKITIPSTVLAMFLSCLAAYPLSKSKMKGRNILLFSFLFASMVPTMAILIPLYLQFIKLNMYDTIWAVIIVLTAYLLPFSIWIMKGFFDTIPDSIEEAAQIDGCNRYQALFRIIMPLALPGIGAIGVYSFISSWSEFLIPLTLTQTKAQTFTMYIGLFVNAESVEISKVLTMGIIANIPVLIFALAFQKFIIKGLTSGAVKG